MVRIWGGSGGEGENKAPGYISVDFAPAPHLPQIARAHWATPASDSFAVITSQLPLHSWMLALF